MGVDEDRLVAKDGSYIVATLVTACLAPIILPPIFRLRTDSEVLIWSIVSALMLWALIDLGLTVYRKANDSVVERIVIGKSRISLRPVFVSENKTKHIDLETIKKISVERSLRHPSRRTMYIEANEKEHSIGLLNLDRSPEEVLDRLCANIEKLGLPVVEQTPAKWRVWKVWCVERRDKPMSDPVASEFDQS